MDTEGASWIPPGGEKSPAPPALVSVRGIRKSFGPTEVLHGIDLDLRPGEVHVLAGENGAGKSTLIKVLSGAFDDYSGAIWVGGKPWRLSRPSQAAEAGIATIHQELSLVPTMSVADNLFLGRERAGRLGGVDFRLQLREAHRILDDTEQEFGPRARVETLPLPAQQILEIARALARDASVVIFDEPTSALGEQEVEALFRRIRELRSQGRGILYITHKMEEIYRLADRITVLRDGAVVKTASAADLPPRELVRWMVGRELPGSDEGLRSGAPSAVVLHVENLRVTQPDGEGRRVVDGVNFSLKEGEILGLAGLQGSGASEVLHALFGALEGRASGRATLLGTPLPLRHPSASVARGLVLLTNDRKALGLAPEMSVTHSISLSSLDRFSGPLGWLRQGEERSAVGRLSRHFRLRAPSLDAPIRAVSGGNQQKAYLARCLMSAPRVLLLDEPTRGIDVGAKADIYSLMQGWVREGIAILLITSEMDELLTLSHRVLVLHRGRVTEELQAREATKDRILAAAMGQETRMQ